VARITCLGPGDCKGRMVVAGRAGERYFTVGKTSFAIPSGRTHVLRMRIGAGALRALRRSGRLRVESTAVVATDGHAGTRTRRGGTIKAKRGR